MKIAKALKKNNRIIYKLLGTVTLVVIGVFSMAMNNKRLDSWIFGNKVKSQSGLDVINSSEDFITNFDYIGTIKTYEAENTGTYKLQVWGAQGGTTQGYTGGYGGYAYGEIQIDQGEELYVVVGGAGTGASRQGQTLDGGYNGGGYVAGNSKVNHMTASRRRSNSYC